MTLTMSELSAVAPALAALAAGALVLLAEPVLRRVRVDLGIWIALAGLTASAALAITTPEQGSVFGGLYSHDRYSTFFALVATGVGVIGLLTGAAFQRSTGFRRPELYALGPLLVAGVQLTAGVRDLVALVVALEIVSLAGYALSGFQVPNEKSRESMMKSFLIGSLCTILSLLGIALLFGATGETRYDAIGAALAVASEGNGAPGAAGPLVALGITAVIAGMGLRLMVFPFSMVVPDILQGAPAPAAGMVAAGPALAATAGLVRLFEGVGLHALGFEGLPALYVAAVATILLGNLVALYQDNVKRMLGYGAVGHAGFLFLGIALAQESALAEEARRTILTSTLFYAAAFAFLQVAAFTLVSSIFFGKRFGEYLAEFRGIGRRCPILGLAFLLVLLSLAGFPPTLGFTAKVGVVGAAIESGHPILAGLALLGWTIGIFFYLRVVVVMYFREDPNAPPMVDSTALRAAMAMIAVLLLGGGLFPGKLLRTALESVGSLF